MSSSAGSGAADASDLITVPVICGATASGKSAVAAWLAQRRDLVVISADSRQIYRGFDVGTAKPSRAELQRVPHRGIDVVEPTQRYSAAQWSELAQRAIAETLAAGRLPIVVGGTGFYIASLFRPLWAQPAADDGRREALQRALDDMPTDELRRWCEAIDPGRARLGRAQLLRAIEVAFLTGRRLSDLHVAQARSASYRASYLLVDAGPESGTRIAERAAAMFEAGWIDEVRALIARVPESAPAWNATGYDVVRELVQGEGRLDRATALERVVIETRQYAKRQRTWFRHQLERDRVQRLAAGASGWQEVVERWISQVEATMRTAADRGAGGGR